MRSGPWNSCVSDPNQYFSGKGVSHVASYLRLVATYIKVQGWFCSVITCANVVEVLRIMEEGSGGLCR